MDPDEFPEEYTETEFLGFRRDLPLWPFSEEGLWGDLL